MPKIQFDGEAVGALPLSYSRDTATWDLDGTSVAVDTPKWDRSAVMYKPALAAGFFDTAGQSRTICGSGFKEDDTTPLTVVFNSTGSSLQVYTGDMAAGFTAGATPDADGNKKDTVSLTVRGGVSDLEPTGAKTNGTNESNRYKPGPCIIYKGVIVMLVEVSITTAPATWAASGVGVCYSTDEGATWTLLYDQVDDNGGTAIDSGNTRVREWSLQGYTPDETDGNTIYYTFSDYIAGGSGGSMWVGRVKKTGVGTWDVDVPGQCFSDYTTAITHTHSGAVVWKDNNLEVWFATGDTQLKNSVQRAILNTGSLTDLENATWTIDDNFHGTVGPFAPSTEWSESGSQFVACLVHPDYDKIVVGSDTKNSPIHSIEFNSSSGRAYIRPEVGRFCISGDGLTPRGADAFYASCTRAEDPAHPRLMLVRETAGFTGSFLGTYTTRIACAYNGRDWGYIASVPNTNTMVLIGDRIYYDTDDAAGSIGWVQVDLAGKKINGLLLENTPENFFADGVGQWFGSPDVNMLETEITDLTHFDGLGLPRPPTEGRTWRITGRRGDTGETNAANVSLINGKHAGTSAIFDSKSIRGRLYFFNPSPSLAGATLWDNTSGNVALHSGNSTEQMERWEPIPFAGTSGGTPSFAPNFRGIKASAANLDYYLHYSMLENLAGCTGYPISWATVEGTPNTGGAEVADITISDTSTAWNAQILCFAPEVGFDETHSNITEEIMATIYVDANNFIQIIADITNLKVIFRETVNGTETLTDTTFDARWLLGSAIYVGASCEGTTMNMAVSVGGRVVATDTKVLSQYIGTPTAIKLASNEDDTIKTNLSFVEVSYGSELLSEADLSSSFQEMLSPSGGSGRSHMRRPPTIIWDDEDDDDTTLVDHTGLGVRS